MLEDFKKQLMEKGIRIEVDAKVIDHLAQVGYDKNFGARPLRRALENELKYPLSEKIIKGEARPGDNLRVKLSDNQIFIENNDFNAVKGG